MLGKIGGRFSIGHLEHSSICKFGGNSGSFSIL